MTQRKKRGGLYKQRCSPHYFADYIDGSGNRRRRSTGCENKKDAQRVRAAWVVEAGKGPSVEHADRVTFEQLEEWVKADYERKGNKSWGRVVGALRHLRLVFKGQRAIRITSNRTYGYDDLRMQQGASAATRQYEQAVLRRMFHVAKKRGRLERIPEFPEIKVNNAREEYVTEREHLLLCKGKKDTEGLPDYARGLQEWMYYAGLRSFTEAVKLTWSNNVDLRGQRLILCRGETKSGEPRTIPFKDYPELKAAVEAQRVYTDTWERIKGRRIASVFHRQGEEMKAFPYGAWRAACVRLGVIAKDGRAKRPHDNKRSMRRRLEESGVSRVVGMRLLGHKTHSIYDRYDVVTEHDLAAATAKLSKAVRHSIGIVEPESEPVESGNLGEDNELPGWRNG